MSISKNKWSEILSFRGSKGWIAIIVVALITSSFLGLMLPIKTTDLARNYGTPEFTTTLFALMVLFIAVYLNRILYQYAINRFVYSIMQHLRLLCYRSWLLTHEGMDEDGKQKGIKEKFPLGEILARIMSDTEAIRELVTSGAFGIIIDIFFVVSGLISFIKLNLISGLALSVFEILALVLLLWGSRGLRDVFMAVRVSRGNLSKTVADVVGGLKESYYSNHFNYGTKKTTEASEDFLKHQLRYNFWDAAYYSVAESLYPLLLAFVFMIAPHSKLTEAAIIFALVDLIQRSINPLKEVSGKIANIQRAQTGLVRINEFLGALNPELVKSDLDNDFKFERLQVQIDKFIYPSKDGDRSFALENIKFDGQFGELIGIVGLSGSGKSTLLNIIAANILPNKMDVSLLGEEGRKIFLSKEPSEQYAYRKLVGIVSQDSHLFSSSVAFNLHFSLDVDDRLTKFWEEAKAMIPYLKKWKIELDTELKVSELSMGQKQLLAGLRSCYLNKPVVLFDEISSGLDSELEEALRKLVLLIQKHALTIIVAHRLETIIGASKILVLDNGRLKETGTHRELLDKSVLYQEFIRELSQSHKA